MKTFKVIASSITYYKIEIEAENEDEAYEIAKYHADGSDFAEIGLGDWEIYDIQETQQVTA
jgi:hypothetical protein